MSAHWGFRIPLLVCVLGACSVYDASLLATSSGVVGAGSSGMSGAQAGSAGNGGLEDSEAGAAGVAASAAGEGGAPAGGGHAGEGGAPSAGASGAAGGGQAGSAGISGAGGAPTALALELIDDMENKDTVIDPTNGRGGDWYAAHDATVGGVQSPTPFVVTALSATDPRYATSKVAAMTNGMGFSDWGANLGFNLELLVGGKHPSYDASAYCGLHFFAKVGVGANPGVYLRVIDRNAHPDGGVCGVGNAPCYHYYLKAYSLSTDWQEKSLLFSDLTCPDGCSKPLDKTALFSVEFGLIKNSKFELWVDDVSFLKKPASGVCPTN